MDGYTSNVGDHIVVVGRKSCPACARYVPVFETEIGARLKAKGVKVTVIDTDQLAGVPTTLVFKDGSDVPAATVVGGDLRGVMMESIKAYHARLGVPEDTADAVAAKFEGGEAMPPPGSPLPSAPTAFKDRAGLVAACEKAAFTHSATIAAWMRRGGGGARASFTHAATLADGSILAVAAHGVGNYLEVRGTIQGGFRVQPIDGVTFATSVLPDILAGDASTAVHTRSLLTRGFGLAAAS